MKEKKSLRHEIAEILEGGLQGSTAARVLAWSMIVLVAASIGLFLLKEQLEGYAWYGPLYTAAEILTIGVFTLEVILGFWTADIRYPKSSHPRLRLLREPMTIIGILAILPFYLGLALRKPELVELMEILELLKLLHLVKVGELIGKKSG